MEGTAEQQRALPLPCMHTLWHLEHEALHLAVDQVERNLIGQQCLVICEGSGSRSSDA